MRVTPSLAFTERVLPPRQDADPRARGGGSMMNTSAVCVLWAVATVPPSQTPVEHSVTFQEIINGTQHACSDGTQGWRKHTD